MAWARSPGDDSGAGAWGTLAKDGGRASFLAIDAWNAEREGESAAAGRTGGCGWEALRDETVMRWGVTAL
ncbi:MAG: hypothetical protein H0T51_20395 [Pirellulales bacterium]|nr:hypothetical protein [Pirellulales bacterium]